MKSLHIEDGYKVIDKNDIFDQLDMYSVLGEIDFKGRTIYSYRREWFAHSFLYRLGMFKSHTKDVDLNEDESELRKFCYFVIYGVFNWFFVKR